ncbi:hypothetical protein GCM10009676_10330 [Prauserella halophila]|uniref:Uncharacterized protein n=1 Tax=Prauserella halophila TaxID=185641 RepID=A0ABN1W1D6_9PSEU|nr:hypothetical protein [Prauserella halophila]MCP2235391.1 hypothetical protein [Prauserella halophila]
MATVVLAALCAVCATAAAVFAARSRRWRRKADAYKGLMAHHQRSAADAEALRLEHVANRDLLDMLAEEHPGELEVLGRLDEVRALAARMQQHAEPDGLTAADVHVFAAKMRSTARGGEQR